LNQFLRDKSMRWWITRRITRKRDRNAEMDSNAFIPRS